MILHFHLGWLAIVLTGFLGIAQAQTQDYVSSGNYQILFCGAGSPDSKASQLQGIIPNTLHRIQALLADVKLGTRSTHGFAAFFKTNDNIPTVQKVFQTMLDAPKVGLDQTKPIFACTDPNNDLTKSVDANCLKWQNVPLVSWPQYGVIFICPYFWTRFPLPFHSDCPTVLNNVLVPDSAILSVNQYAAMIQQLVHLYVPGVRSTADEVSQVQEAVNLDAKASLGNANNYALYAAGKPLGNWQMLRG